MIKKLYNLKKVQTEQNILQKQQLVSSIDSLDDEIEQTYHSINTATVQSIGSISDFKILQIHKNTMKEHAVKLNQKKARLQSEVKKYDQIINQLNMETEQFKYIKEKQEVAFIKEQIKQEELVSAEFVQAKWAANR